MKKISITISNLPNFRPFVKTPREITVDDQFNILQIIQLLDEEYQTKIRNDGKNHQLDFMDDRIISLFQLLWNPNEQRFYDDVGVEARTSPPESNAIPIETQWEYNLPPDAWVVLTPDSGC